MTAGRPLNVKDGFRKCSNCFQFKELEAFYPKRYKVKSPLTQEEWVVRVGWQSRCKECNTEVVRGYHERAREKLEHNSPACDLCLDNLSVMPE